MHKNGGQWVTFKVVHYSMLHWWGLLVEVNCIQVIYSNMCCSLNITNDQSKNLMPSSITQETDCTQCSLASSNLTSICWPGPVSMWGEAAIKGLWEWLPSTWTAQGYSNGQSWHCCHCRYNSKGCNFYLASFWSYISHVIVNHSVYQHLFHHWKPTRLESS